MAKEKAYRRLDRILAEAGYGTRSQVKKFIQKGHVAIAGEVVTDPSTRIDAEQLDVLTFDGLPVLWEDELFYMLNKPQGCVTAKVDGRYPTVMDYVPYLLIHRDASPAGRLDLDTEGLLIITTDGQAVHRLTSPKWEVPKTYRFEHGGPAFTDQEIALLAEGLELPDHGPLKPAELRNLSETEGELVITEGIFHQVKRMIEALGRSVKYLQRTKFGPLSLDPLLDPGEGRPLTPEERDALEEAIR